MHLSYLDKCNERNFKFIPNQLRWITNTVLSYLKFVIDLILQIKFLLQIKIFPSKCIFLICCWIMTPGFWLVFLLSTCLSWLILLTVYKIKSCMSCNNIWTESVSGIYISKSHSCVCLCVMHVKISNSMLCWDFRWIWDRS